MTEVESSLWARGRLRRASSADVPAIVRLVHSAYEKYISRIGRKPKPMLADYAHAVDNHQLWVVCDGESLFAVLELIPNAGHLLIENIAVQPELQRSGYGRELMTFAEAEAKRMGFHELRLYTNERFTENICLYKIIGYKETHRESYLGSDVVHMAKRIE